MTLISPFCFSRGILRSFFLKGGSYVSRATGGLVNPFFADLYLVDEFLGEGNPLFGVDLDESRSLFWRFRR